MPWLLSSLTTMNGAINHAVRRDSLSLGVIYSILTFKHCTITCQAIISQIRAGAVGKCIPIHPYSCKALLIEVHMMESIDESLIVIAYRY